MLFTSVFKQEPKAKKEQKVDLLRGDAI